MIDETTDISWSTPANWGSESDIPTSADTVTIPAGKEVYVDVAASVLAITATGDVTIKGPSNAKTSLAATSFVGSGSLTVSENVALSIGVMDVDGKITMTQSNIDSNSYADNLADANVGNMDIKNGFSGSGVLINNGTLELTGNDTFIGTIGGGQSVTKKGDDTYMLIGNNTFTGGLAIEKGTLKLGSYADFGATAYNLDATDSRSIVVEDGVVTEWKDSARNVSFKRNNEGDAIVQTTDYFGGANALLFGFGENGKSQYTCKAPLAQMVAIVYYEVEAREHAHLWGENYYRVRGIHRRASGNNYNYWTKAQGSDAGVVGGVYVNGSHSGTITSKANQIMVAAEVSDVCRNNQTAALGSSYAAGNTGSSALSDGYSFKGAIGEIIALNRNLSHAERKAMEGYLMVKWGIYQDAYNVIPTSADVTMKSGATLDMGGLTQTVASFTGAGTVANGYLKTTGDLTVDGGTLTIQATAGQTYVLSDVEAERLVLTGTAKDYFVKVPDNGRIVGRFVVPEGISVGFEGEGADVTVVNAPKGWEITSKQITGGILYRVGSFPFKLILR